MERNINFAEYVVRKMTMRTIPLLLICALLTGCVFNTISGSGRVTTETRNVSGFSAISMGGSGRVVVEQTGTESLTVTADDNLLPYIKTEVHGNELSLGVKDFTNISPSTDITYKVTVKNLDGLSISGSGMADAQKIQTKRLKIEISGSGKAKAVGSADDLELSISGSGDYEGDRLQTKRADISISGSGSATVAASDKLDANVSGSGSVTYTGEPRVTQQISGSGSVRKR